MTNAKLKDGDDPWNVEITYRRSAVGLEMAVDLLRMTAPTKWRQMSLKLLDRDVLLNDESWSALLRRRERFLGKAPTLNLPSYCTRVTVAHQIAAAASAFEILDGQDDISALDALEDDTRSLRDDDPPDGGWASMREVSMRVWELSGNKCEAHEFHHELCPIDVTTENWDQFKVHHIYPREQAKRYGIDKSLIDLPSNCILVWNRYPRAGAAGCHGKIHREQTGARAKGLLAEKNAML